MKDHTVWGLHAGFLIPDIPISLAEKLYLHALSYRWWRFRAPGYHKGSIVADKQPPANEKQLN